MKKKYSFKKAAIFIFLLFVIRYGIASPAYSSESPNVAVFEITASVEMSDNNLFNARNAAVKKCQTQAVKQALYAIISEKPDINKAEFLKTDIYNNSEQFVKSYKILYETSYNKHYTVAASIDVLTDKLLNKLNITEIENNEINISKIKIIVETDNTDGTSIGNAQTDNITNSPTYDQNISSSVYNHLRPFVQFEEKLNSIENIRQVVTTKITRNKREILTSFKGSADDLAEVLMLMDFNEFKISIDKIEADILKVNIIRQP